MINWRSWDFFIFVWRVMDKFWPRLDGLIVDRASVNAGINKELEVLLKEPSPCITLVHCSNHRFELAMKDAFKETFFDDTDIVFIKNSPKRLQESTL